jgi:hypothetical protein
MKRMTMFGAAGAALLMAGSVFAGPVMAEPQRGNTPNQGTQNNKNLMRNLGIGLGAAAVFEAIRGNNTNALILGAGAGLAGTQYEKYRKEQSRNNDWRNDRWDGRDDRRDNRQDRREDRRDDRRDRREDRRDDRRDNRNDRDGRWDRR